MYHTLQSSIDTASVTHNFVNDSRRPNVAGIISDSSTKSLPYLQACIKEGLRMWPPVTGLFSKQVPAEGDTLDGRFVPGGTQIGYCAWGMHHRKETFGEDAHVFRPERWLEAKEDRLRIMERSNEMVFGSGKYGCLGKGVAIMEIGKVIVEVRPFCSDSLHIHSSISLILPCALYIRAGIAKHLLLRKWKSLTKAIQLLRRFDITLIDPVHGFTSKSFGIFIQSGMNVRITERKGRRIIFKDRHERGDCPEQGDGLAIDDDEI